MSYYSNTSVTMSREKCIHWEMFLLSNIAQIETANRSTYFSRDFTNCTGLYQCYHGKMFKYLVQNVKGFPHRFQEKSQYFNGAGITGKLMLKKLGKS